MLDSLKAKLRNEILVICIITIMLIPIIAFSPSNALRIIFGLPFVLLFPGYTLIAALFPRKGTTSGTERLALSIALSLAIVIIIGFVLNYIWAISLYPVLISLALFIFIMSTIAWWRRRRLPEAERFAIAFQLSPFPWKGQDSLSKALSIALVVALLGGIGTSSHAFIKSRQSYTEFYVLGPVGMAEGYPQQLHVGQAGNVILVIKNSEHRDVSYKLEVWINGVEQTDKEKNITLADGRSWEQKVSFSFGKAGGNQKVEFVLYKDGKTYLDPLHLWIDVK